MERVAVFFASLVIIASGLLGVGYEKVPPVRMWVELNLFNHEAYYYLGRVIPKPDGATFWSTQFYSRRWADKRINGADNDSVRANLRGASYELVVATWVDGKPNPGRILPNQDARIVSIAQNGDCYFVRDIVCGDKFVRASADDQCSLLGAQSTPVWLKLTHVTCDLH